MQRYVLSYATLCKSMTNFGIIKIIQKYSQVCNRGGLTNADNTEKNTLQGANKFLPFKMLSSNICNFGIFF